MKKLQEIEKIEFSELLKNFSISQYKQGFQEYLKDIWNVNDYFTFRN
jgi:hypothetical protein